MQNKESKFAETPGVRFHSDAIKGHANIKAHKVALSAEYMQRVSSIYQQHREEVLYKGSAYKNALNARTLRNRTYIYTQFDAHSAGNSVSELPDFKFFSGGMPPDPPCQYHRLLLSNWLLTSNFIETPAQRHQPYAILPDATK